MHRRHRSNPSTRIRRYRHSGRRRSNPGVAGFSTTELVKLAGGAAVGVVGSKWLAQTVLQGNNAGAMGAVAQGVATLALAWVANKFMGKDVATGVAAGGLGVTLWSLIQQYTGTGGNVSGLGDPEISRFLGDFQSGNTNATPSMWNPMVVPAVPKSNGRSRG
jgi:hypothetical protein